MTAAVRPVLGGSPTKRWRLRGYRGAPSPLVDVAPVRAHLAYLTGLQLPYAEIARACSLPTSTVQSAAYGPVTRVFRWVAAAILGVDGRPHPAQDRVLPHGFYRRSRALMTCGWSVVYQAQRLDVARSNRVWEEGNLTTIMSHLHWQMAALYTELSHLPGPSKHAITWARKLGHPGPFAWDDEDIDRPDAQPADCERDPDGELNLGEDAAFLMSWEGGNVTVPGVIGLLKVEGRTDEAKANTVWQAVRRYRLAALTAEDLHDIRLAAYRGAYGEDLAAEYLLTPGQITGLLAGTLREDLPRPRLDGPRSPIRQHLMH